MNEITEDIVDSNLEQKHLSDISKECYQALLDKQIFVKYDTVSHSFQITFFNYAFPVIGYLGMTPDRLQHLSLTHQAAMSVFAENYLNHHVTGIMRNGLDILWGERLTSFCVMHINKFLDDQINSWVHRPLDRLEAPYIFVDYSPVSIYHKKKKVNRYILAAACLNTSTDKDCSEVIGFEICSKVDATAFEKLFNQLKARGLADPKLIVCKPYEGLVEAAQAMFKDIKWQHCASTFGGVLRYKMKPELPKEAKQLVKHFYHYKNNYDSAMKHKAIFIKLLQNQPEHQARIDYVNQHMEDILRYLDFPQAHRRRIRSASYLYDKFITFRYIFKTIDAFDNEASARRYIGAFFME